MFSKPIMLLVDSNHDPSSLQIDVKSNASDIDPLHYEKDFLSPKYLLSEKDYLLSDPATSNSHYNGFNSFASKFNLNSMANNPMALNSQINSLAAGVHNQLMNNNSLNNNNSNNTMSLNCNSNNSTNPKPSEALFIHILLSHCKRLAPLWFKGALSMREKNRKEHKRGYTVSGVQTSSSWSAVVDKISEMSCRAETEMVMNLLKKLYKELASDSIIWFIKCWLRLPETRGEQNNSCVLSRGDARGRMRRIDGGKGSDKVWRLDTIVSMLYHGMPMSSTDTNIIVHTCNEELCVRPQHLRFRASAVALAVVLKALQQGGYQLIPPSSITRANQLPFAQQHSLTNQKSRYESGPPSSNNSIKSSSNIDVITTNNNTNNNNDDISLDLKDEPTKEESLLTDEPSIPVDKSISNANTSNTTDCVDTNPISTNANTVTPTTTASSVLPNDTISQPVVVNVDNANNSSTIQVNQRSGVGSVNSSDDYDSQVALDSDDDVERSVEISGPFNIEQIQQYLQQNLKPCVQSLEKMVLSATDRSILCANPELDTNNISLLSASSIINGAGPSSHGDNNSLTTGMSHANYDSPNNTFLSNHHHHHPQDYSRYKPYHFQNYSSPGFGKSTSSSSSKCTVKRLGSSSNNNISGNFGNNDCKSSPTSVKRGRMMEQSGVGKQRSMSPLHHLDQSNCENTQPNLQQHPNSQIQGQKSHHIPSLPQSGLIPPSAPPSVPPPSGHHQGNMPHNFHPGHGPHNNPQAMTHHQFFKGASNNKPGGGNASMPPSPFHPSFYPGGPGQNLGGSHPGLPPQHPGLHGIHPHHQAVAAAAAARYMYNNNNNLHPGCNNANSGNNKPGVPYPPHHQQFNQPHIPHNIFLSQQQDQHPQTKPLQLTNNTTNNPNKQPSSRNNRQHPQFPQQHTLPYYPPPPPPNPSSIFPFRQYPFDTMPPLGGASNFAASRFSSPKKQNLYPPYSHPQHPSMNHPYSQQSTGLHRPIPDQKMRYNNSTDTNPNNSQSNNSNPPSNNINTSNNPNNNNNIMNNTEEESIRIPEETPTTHNSNESYVKTPTDIDKQLSSPSMLDEEHQQHQQQHQMNTNSASNNDNNLLITTPSTSSATNKTTTTSSCNNSNSATPILQQQAPRKPVKKRLEARTPTFELGEGEVSKESGGGGSSSLDFSAASTGCSAFRLVHKSSKNISTPPNQAIDLATNMTTSSSSSNPIQKSSSSSSTSHNRQVIPGGSSITDSIKADFLSTSTDTETELTNILTTTSNDRIHQRSSSSSLSLSNSASLTQAALQHLAQQLYPHTNQYHHSNNSNHSMSNTTSSGSSSKKLLLAAAAAAAFGGAGGSANQMMNDNQQQHYQYQHSSSSTHSQHSHHHSSRHHHHHNYPSQSSSSYKPHHHSHHHHSHTPHHPPAHHKDPSSKCNTTSTSLPPSSVVPPPPPGSAAFLAAAALAAAAFSSSGSNSAGSANSNSSHHHHNNMMNLVNAHHHNQNNNNPITGGAPPPPPTCDCDGTNNECFAPNCCSSSAANSRTSVKSYSASGPDNGEMFVPFNFVFSGASRSTPIQTTPSEPKSNDNDSSNGVTCNNRLSGSISSGQHNNNNNTSSLPNSGPNFNNPDHPPPPPPNPRIHSSQAHMLLSAIRSSPMASNCSELLDLLTSMVQQYGMNPGSNINTPVEFCPASEQQNNTRSESRILAHIYQRLCKASPSLDRTANQLLQKNYSFSPLSAEVDLDYLRAAAAVHHAARVKSSRQQPSHHGNRGDSNLSKSTHHSNRETSSLVNCSHTNIHHKSDHMDHSQKSMRDQNNNNSHVEDVIMMDQFTTSSNTPTCITSTTCTNSASTTSSVVNSNTSLPPHKDSSGTTITNKFTENHTESTNRTLTPTIPSNNYPEETKKENKENSSEIEVVEPSNE